MKEAIENLVMLNDELLEALFVYLESNPQDKLGKEITEHLNSSMRLMRDLE